MIGIFSIFLYTLHQAIELRILLWLSCNCPNQLLIWTDICYLIKICFGGSYCCASYGIKHLTTRKISVQSLLVFRLQKKLCQHKHDKLEVSSEEHLRTHKHFISKTINKTKATAIPMNASVFKLLQAEKKPLCINFRVLGRLGRSCCAGSISWVVCCLCRRRLQGGSPPFSQRPGLTGSCLAAAGLLQLCGV